MPKSKSVAKRRRQSEKRRLRNKAAKSRIRTLTKRFKSSSKGEKESQVLLSQVVSAYDKAARKGVIHPRTAARRKSKLTKPAKAQPTTKKKRKPKASPEAP